MNGKLRREMIEQLLRETKVPISGSALSKKMKISRQAIVQDIALLRASDKNIISTNKGYMIYEKEEHIPTRTFCVNHGDDEIEEELNIFVDNGGKVLDVVVEHDVYGQITADLILNSRKDVKDFVGRIRESHMSKPLKELTDGKHYHTVEANDEADFSYMEKELRERGFLVEDL